MSHLDPLQCTLSCCFRYELRAKLKRRSVNLEEDNGDPLVTSERRVLQRELKKWREMQTLLLARLDTSDHGSSLSDVESDSGPPGDDDNDDDGSVVEFDDAAAPEDEPLALPSDFSPSERRSLGLEALAVFERRIRNGCAYDLLTAVKESINHQGAFLAEKQQHA